MLLLSSIPAVPMFRWDAFEEEVGSVGVSPQAKRNRPDVPSMDSRQTVSKCSTTFNDLKNAKVSSAKTVILNAAVLAPSRQNRVHCTR